MAQVIQIKTTYPKSSRIGVEKTKIVKYFELNRDALLYEEELRSKNSNPNITYKAILN